ncbi:hypothetical protein Cni_G16801 [Canna indica]|uniref:Uncharacterized protein n=1 Tax=Canna indica TaxID=4628 RepID=A0AAQ3KFT2_9LILI|nr:hypothetical protein Cni_G16801 [Canna indica]
MVAISLYRGNLHRVSDTPRRWPLPPQTIPLRQFKILIRKRSESLSRLATALAAATTPDVKNAGTLKEEDQGDGGGDERANVDPSSRQDVPVPDPQPSNSQLESKEHAAERDPVQDSRAGASFSNAPAGVSSALEEEIRDSKPGGAGEVDGHLEERNNYDAASDKEERKRELEKKLHVLNEKKHNLVQMLKQILNAEEEIKRRSMQSPVLRPSIPQKAETTFEMVATKQVPKLTVEVNFGSDSGGESDAAANHNNYGGRQLHHVHSTSPSAGSLTRTTFSSLQHNPGLPNSRTSLPAIGHSPTTPSSLMGSAMASPSRFAPTGHQSQTSNLPPLALPVNHFMASSPSPAASAGASSVFMDPRSTNSS